MSATERRQFVAPLLADLAPGGQATTCRVCAEPIAEGEPRWTRAWHVEQAHERCGYLRADEHEPVERTRPGSFARYWTWRCPSCGLDAAQPRRPREGDPRECLRCRPRPELALGVVAELVGTTHVLVGRGKRARRVAVPAHSRVRVVDEHADGQHVLVELVDEVPGVERLVCSRVVLRSV